MKALVCEMCNGTDIVKQDGFFVCQHCGMKYSAEEAKKMMVEGTVKIDTSGELANLYQVARRAKEDNNDETAGKYYDMILAKDPTSWEASFYTVYFRSKQCKIAHIASAGVDVANCQNSVMALIHDYVKDEEKQIEAVKEVIASSANISSLLFMGAINHYNGIDFQIRDKYTNEKNTNCAAALAIMGSCGDAIAKNFADNKNISKLAGDAWFWVLTLDDSYSTISVDSYKTYKEKIKGCGVEYEKKILEKELLHCENKKKSISKRGGRIALTLTWGAFFVAIIKWFMPIMKDANIDFLGWIFAIIAGIVFFVKVVDLFQDPQKIEKVEKEIEAKKKELENLKTKE